MNLKGKVAIVTGAGSGIGAALCHELFIKGARVVLAGRRLDKLQETAAVAPEGASLCVATDVGDVAQLARLVDLALERFKVVDAVFNNAGVVYGPTLVDQSPLEVEQQVLVNLLAPIQLTRLVVPALKARPEALIVNVASMSALVGLAYQTVYAATKHGLRGFSQALRRELAGTSVNVLTVHPTTVASETFHDGPQEQVRQLRFPVMTAQDAAHRILTAAERGERDALICAPSERMMPLIDRFMPSLIDRMMRRHAPTMAKIVGEMAAHSRRRNAASTTPLIEATAMSQGE